MKIGIFVGLTANSMPVTRLAKKIEALGFESFWLPDHILMPVEMASRSPSGASAPDHYRRMVDPLVALAAAAGVTERLRLGTAVLVLPLRNPLVTAKAVATLDLVSQGRLSLGIGAGWVREEADILGGDFPNRWRQAREHIEAMKVCWSPGAASFSGEYIRFPEIHSEPAPLQRPHPPVLVAADGPKALGRVAEMGDGWIAHAARTPPEVIEAGRKNLERAWAERGGQSGSRPGAPEITIFGAKPERDILRDYAAAGAERAILMIGEESEAETVPRLEGWAAELL